MTVVGLKIGGLGVTAQDREAYIQLEDYDGAWADYVRAGKCDDVMGMQLLAAHRVATLEEAAKVADRSARQSNRLFESSAGGDEGKDRNAARYRTAVNIATAIRNLKGAGA